LYPGMYAKVTLQLERHAGVLKLPDQSINAAADGNFVFVVRNGRLDRVRVTTGINNGRTVEIASGLSRDDQVVETYSPALTAGERVRPVIPQALTRNGGASTVTANLAQR
ncbi:MAG: hypothetical protein ACREQN_11060, partial [Candidatus Binataceae bacterium]